MTPISPLAKELNEKILTANASVEKMLSKRGKSIFFPTKGILAQSAEARGKDINATIGTALEEDGSPLCLPCLKEMTDSIDPSSAFLYASSYGNPKLRSEWKTMLYQKNPSLKTENISLPVVTQALTHALSMAGYLFVDEGEEIIQPDLFWGNYNLIFKEQFGTTYKTFNTFKNGGFDVDAMIEAINAGGIGKKILLLNFPNNPTGYTATKEEAIEIKKALLSAAEAGNQLVVLLDDAYFGLVYEEGVYEESLFVELADLHENLLAVKIDGPTKEDYVWGFRVGFITFGIKGGTEELYSALEAKTGGAIRGNISNAPAISQALLLKAFTHPEYSAQKLEKYNILKSRYEKVSKILADNPEYKEAFEALPFNSGYFMCVKLNGTDPETVRQVLLKDYSTGVISACGVIRLAFSATPLNKLDELFKNLYNACLSVKEKSCSAQA